MIQNAAEVDIDHVVPLNWAWGHGASSWPRQKREKFANDPVNLIPVEASLNRSTITI
ncbi:HNH endonuclease family protein [Marinobacter nauticus]|uniref:HNH endonuclease family protein n=1 Tax=Marinobacter nauticus TaxID=2743 RepID=UPI001F3923A8|nr:HNH endonuclease family protein [Marinobacter nauticus]